MPLPEDDVFMPKQRHSRERIGRRALRSVRAVDVDGWLSLQATLFRSSFP